MSNQPPAQQYNYYSDSVEAPKLVSNEQATELKSWLEKPPVEPEVLQIAEVAREMEKLRAEAMINGLPQ